MQKKKPDSGREAELQNQPQKGGAEDTGLKVKKKKKKRPLPGGVSAGKKKWDPGRPRCLRGG